MKYSVRWQNELITQSHVLCMTGLLFSQTHLLINFSLDPSIYYAPRFTLAYFLLSILALLILMMKYSFFKGVEGAVAIQFFQHLGIPVSVILLRLYFQHDSSNSLGRVVCLILFLSQCVLIAIKIIYLGSVSQQLAQISGLTKLSRVLKLVMVAIVPQFVSAALPLVIILSICEIITIYVFFLKYTYQKCSVQYVLLVGIIAGFISSLECMLAAIFEYSYYFLGECFIIAVFLVPQTPLISLLELKYRVLFAGLAENKSQDEHLAELLFLRQCVFANCQTLHFTQTMKDEAILQIASLIQRTKKMLNRQIQSNDGQLQQQSYLFLDQIQKSGRLLEQAFFQLILTRFKQTSNFQALVFTVYSAFQLPQKYSVYAMILFYSFRQRTLQKMSSLQQCRFQIIYRQIVKRFSKQYKDPQQIAFVQFSERLQQLGQAIQKCLSEQIELIEALTNDGKRSQIFIDPKLLKLHEMKRTTRKIISNCLQNKLYLNSNQFKYTYLLYYTAIEKKYSQLKENIKSKFISIQIKTLQLSYFQKYLAVLNGFSNGEIVNSNEAFKSYFKFSTSYQSKSTISQLFPTDKQKRKHSSLMLETQLQVSQREGEHSKYECLLAVEAEVNNNKFKVIQSFKIATRLYCQNQNGFNYVCQLSKLRQNNQDVVIILKKERDILDKRGLTFNPSNLRAVKQLQDQIEICDIQGDFRNESFETLSKLSNVGQMRGVQPENGISCPIISLYDKIKLIEQKMLEQKKINQNEYKLNIRSIFQLFIILLLGMGICLAYWQLSASTNFLNFTFTTQKKAMRDSNLIRNRIMVQKMILTIVKGSIYFPDFICKYQQINNLTQYFINYAENDLTKNLDDYRNLMVSKVADSNVLPTLYSNTYASIPYLMNYQKNLTFQKYLALLKAKQIYWLSQLNSAKLPKIDYGYYSLLFPNQLLSYSSFAKGSQYWVNDVTSSAFYDNLLSLTNKLKIIFSIIIIGVGIIIITFRIKDTIPIIKLLAAFESINNKVLTSRLKQLKYSLNLLKRIKTTRIMALEIDSHGLITIQNDKQVIQTKFIQNFTQEEKAARKIRENTGDNEVQSQNATLLKYRQLQNSHRLPESHLISSLIYNRWYVVIVLLLIGSMAIICIKFVGCFSAKIESLQAFEQVDEMLTLLSQKYLNIVAYDWLNALSIVTPGFDMSAVSQLYNDSLATFKASNMQDLFYKNYPNALANQILYSDICKYFLTPGICPTFRAGVFTGGISLILPITIKSQIEGLELSSNNHSYYIPNICDKTYIMFEGLVPINKKVPLYGLQVLLGSIDNIMTIYIVVMGLLIVALFIVTVIGQQQRKGRQKKLQQEILSLDTVGNLYHISDLKPYFNIIYYS